MDGQVAKTCQTEGVHSEGVEGSAPGELRAWGSRSLREGRGSGRGWTVAEADMSGQLLTGMSISYTQIAPLTLACSLPSCLSPSPTYRATSIGPFLL